MKHIATIAAATVLGLAAIPAATGAGSASFNDTIGDGNGAADVKTVVVSNDDSGQVTIRVNVDALPRPSDTRVFVFIDTDRNRATGDANAVGADYAFVDNSSDSSYALGRWNGSAWDDAPSPTARVFADGGGVTFSINESDLGNTSAFDFWVRTRLGDPSGTAADSAPDGGDLWTYTLRASAPAAPTITKLVVPASSVFPKAGATFTFRISQVMLSTNELTAPDRVTCKATLTGKALASTRPGGCTWKLPKTARRKTLVVTVTAVYGGDRALQRFPLRVS
jgi:hypothetical protein